ncbi:hypothetical protein [Streptomyces sparsogenes]|uniref:Uncharacterized protein n=1 Tax=Streptomyces sparsogenes DSM 40356 TaxID=1331668 RepID=A0A1R1S7X7_9ACTN|nr:hypothetical protein [Streptomyces sparsogenes]OMI34426.1 hypothetical protein SPAR_36621 [Streptomyces sparsogenes DSM 40356]
MFGTKAVHKAIDELKTSVGGLREALTNAIKQGLDGIKASIDEIRNDTQRTSNAAETLSGRIDNLHSEIQGLRGDIERLRTSVEATTRAVADGRSDERILGEIADLRAAVEGCRADAAEARQAATEVPQAEQQQAQAATGEADTGDFDKLLDLAAGVAYAEISCHRDTWDFLVAQSSRGQHFRLPGMVEEKDCLIDADLSGRTLIAVLDALWHTQRNPDVEPGTRRLAAKVYGRIGDALGKVEADGSPEQHRAGAEQRQPDVTRIVIDDRPPAEASN